MYYSTRRRQFLIDQGNDETTLTICSYIAGYAFKVLTGIGMEHTLALSKKEDQLSLLTKVFFAPRIPHESIHTSSVYLHLMQ